MPPEVGTRRKLLFAATTATILLLLIELGLQAGYFLIRGRFIWERDEFRVGRYYMIVNDERYVSLRPGARESRDGWDVEIDEHGFRVGDNALSNTHPNIAVIGDSVPFGLGIAGRETYPSILQEFLRAKGDLHGVINAAVPAYSLDQAVQRYRYELAGRYDIDVLVLQIYDPAMSFLQLGPDWDVTKSWWNFPGKYRTGRESSMLIYSALWNVIYHVRLLARFEGEQLDVDDKAAIDRYVGSIKASLDHLERLAEEGHVRTILLLPVTLQPTIWKTSSDRHRLALTLLNNALRDATQRYANMRFVDTRTLFASDTDGENFIDACHLSPRGARRVASMLSEAIPPPRP
jgi:hypothetical protein